MRWSPWALLTANLLVSTNAFAMGASLGTTNTPPVIEARLAVSVAPGQTTRWAQVRFASDAGAIAWLVPVWPGGRIDEVSQAWLDALDQATSPSSPCNSVDATQVRALETTLLNDSVELERFSAEWGFAASSELSSRVDAFTKNGGRLLALVYASTATANWTMPVRVTDSASPDIPLVLTRAGTAPVPITVFAIADARIRVGTERFLSIDATRNACGGANPLLPTGYCSYREALLLGVHGSQWLLEYAGPDALWGARRGEIPVDAVAHTYLSLAVPHLAPACLSSMQIALEQASPAQRACPRAGLGMVPAADGAMTPSPCTTAAATPSAFHCGGADDLALALSGLVPSNAWITRAVGLVAPNQFGAQWDVKVEPGPAQARYRAEGGCEDAGTLDANTNGPSGETSPNPTPPPVRGGAPNAATVPTDGDTTHSGSDAGPSGERSKLDGGLEWPRADAQVGTTDRKAVGTPGAAIPSPQTGVPSPQGTASGQASSTIQVGSEESCACSPHSAAPSGGGSCSGSSQPVGNDEDLEESSNGCDGSTPSEEDDGSSGCDGTTETATDSESSDCSSEQPESDSCAKDSSLSDDDSSLSDDSSSECSVAKRKPLRLAGYRIRFSVLLLAITGVLCPARRLTRRRR